MIDSVTRMCQACEGRREQERRSARPLPQRRGSLSLFADVFSS